MEIYYLHGQLLFLDPKIWYGERYITIFGKMELTDRVNKEIFVLIFVSFE